MKKQERKWNYFSIVYGVLLLFGTIYIIYATKYGHFAIDPQKEQFVDFGSEWTTEENEVIDISRLPDQDQDGKLVIEKRLPDELSGRTSLNFNSHNVYFTLKIEGEEPYVFYLEKNLTGAGYGDYFHSIHLTKQMAGEKVVIMTTSAFPGEESVGFENVMLGDPNEYYHQFLLRHGLSALLSLLIIFFGFVVLTVRFSILNRHMAGYDLISLSATIILLGMWTLLETRIPQMLTGATSLIRALDYALLLFVGYPMVAFINSLTKKPKQIYNQIVFYISVITIAFFVSIRFIAGTDMHKITLFTHISFVIDIIIIGKILYSNYRYCKSKRTDDNLKYFYIGATAFAAGGISDLLIYNLLKKANLDHGVFLRIGLIMFIIMMFIQIMTWISAERRLNKRDRFINNLLQYSMSGDSAEETIGQMLEYLGNELEADRAYIFEDKWDGTFDNTYEWCRDGVEPEIDNLKKVPFDGFLDTWYHEFDKSHHIIIRDIEGYKKVSELIYMILKPQGIETLVTGPLEVRGRYIGFFGVDNPPEDRMDEISEIIRLVAYFMTVVLKQRDEQRALINYSYYDQMTGAKNRRAEQEFIDEELDKNAAYGFLMCDINGLKQMNDTQGHEAGDNLICDVADILIMVFGKNNVYRLGGDEFAAFGLWKTKEKFEHAVENVRQLLSAKGRSASLGGVFRPHGDFDFDKVKNEADLLMYADKAAYYEAHPELNRRG